METKIYIDKEIGFSIAMATLGLFLESSKTADEFLLSSIHASSLRVAVIIPNPNYLTLSRCMK